MNLDQYIESILFFKGSPVSVSFLAKVLGKKSEEVEEALGVLEKRLQGGGLVLTRHEGKVSLGTAPKASGFIEALMKEELSKDIGKAGLEVLSIVIYKHPVSRGEIDHIRGVNSSFILRNLMIRGLIEKTRGRDDQRISLYEPTTKLLSFLGLSNLDKMPQYREVRLGLEDLEESKEEKKDKNDDGE